MPNFIPWPFRKSRLARGVDTDGNRWIQVDARRQRGRIVYQEVAADSPPPDPSTLISAVMLQRESFARWISTPLTSARKAVKVIPSLLDIQLPFSLETCEYAIVETAATPNRRGVAGLVVGARHTDIEARLRLLQEMALCPHILDQEAMALWEQLLAECPVAAHGSTSLLVYVASDRLTLVVGRNGRFVAAHTMKDFHADSLYRAVKPYLAQEPDSLIWFQAGPATAHHPAQQAIDSVSSMLDVKPPTLINEPSTFLARAAARRALCLTASRTNLRRGRFLHPVEAERMARRSYLAAAACLVAGLFLLASNIAWRVAAEHRSATLQNALREAAVSITGNPRLVPPKQELTAAKRSVEAQALLYAPFVAPFQPPLTAPLKAAIAAANTHSMTIEAVTLNRRAMVMHGLAPDWNKCERAAASLSQEGWRPRLEHKETRATGTQVGYVLRLTPRNETL